MIKLFLWTQLSSKDLCHKILATKLCSPWMKRCTQDGTTSNGKMLLTTQNIDTIDSMQEFKEDVKSMKSFSKVSRQSKMKMILTLATLKLLLGNL